MNRNEAGQVVTAQLNALSDGTPVISGTTTITVIKDGVGSASAGTISHVNGGLWKYLPTQAETDAAHLAFVFTNVLAGTQTPQMYTIVGVNLLSINGNTLPVDNLAKQYDNTGLLGDTFPATQSQIGNITTGSGGISTTSTGVVITSGNEAGLYTDTFALDLTYHSFTPSVGSIDFYYETNIGESTIATSVLWEGYLQSNNDIISVYAWNWTSSSWVQIDVLFGSNGVSFLAETFILTNNMTGTVGGDNGKIRLRFQSATATNISTDRILFGYTAIAENAFVLHSGVAQGGSNNTITLDINSSANDKNYVNSRVITTSGTGAEQENIITDYNGTTKVATVKEPWAVNPNNTTGFNITPAQVHCATSAGGYDNSSVYINGINGSAGTLVGVNGTSTNPSNNMADARTIADTQNIQKFTFSGGSLLTLDQTYSNFVFEVVQGQFLDLGGQDISGSVFMRSGVTGNMTITNGARAIFELCGVLDANLGVCNLLQSGIVGTLTLGEQAQYLFWDCFEFTGVDSPIINVNGNNTTKTTLEILSYEGRVILSNITSVDEIVVTGNVHLTLDASCNGGTLTYSGDVKITDNSTVSPTTIAGVTQDIEDALALVIEDTGATLPAQISALNNFDSANDVVANVALVDVTTINTDMVDAPNNQGIVDTEAKVDAVLAGLVVVDTKVSSILTDTNTTIPDLINTLENLSAAEVKAEVVAALSVDITVEPTTVPSSTAPLVDKLSYLFAFAANKLTQTASLQTVRNSSDTADISSATLDSTVTTTTKGKHT